MKRSETRKINSKKREWDEVLRPIEAWIRKYWRKFKKSMDIIFDWYFFYKAKGKGDKALHIIMWVLITLALMRIFGII